MFNIGLGEILFISILVLVFIGPERLPKLMRQLGEYTAQVRGIIRSFNQEFSEELKPLYEIRNLADDLNPTRQLGNLLDPNVQRQAPQQKVAAPKTNPMADVSQSSSDSELQVNPMAQISQAMMLQSTDDSRQSRVSSPDTPGTKTPHTSPMAQISQAMTAESTHTQSPSASDKTPSDDDAQEE